MIVYLDDILIYIKGPKQPYIKAYAQFWINSGSIPSLPTERNIGFIIIRFAF